MTTRSLTLITLVLTASLTAHLDADWPAFRGGSLSGIGNGTPPTSFDVAAGTNVAWRTAVPGLGHSSPIVSGSIVLVTTAVSSADAPLRTGAAGVVMANDLVEHEWRLYALDRATGRILWQQTADRGVPRVTRHMKNTYATATPATDGRSVVAIMGSQGLFAYTMQGQLKWKVDLGVVDLGMAQDPGLHYGSASSPVIAGSRVIVQNDRKQESFLAAYDLETGRELWKTARDEWSAWATPVVTTVGGRELVITNSPRRVRATDITNGQEVWSFADGIELKIPTPSVVGSNVVVTGGFPNGTRPLVSLPLASMGEITADKVTWRVERGSAYTTSPLVYDGILYVLGDAGILSAYDPATGQRIYQTRVSETAGGFTASPVAANGRIFLVSEDGDVYVVRAGREFAVESTNRLNEISLATPALDGNLIIFRTRGQIVAVGRP